MAFFTYLGFSPTSTLVVPRQYFIMLDVLILCLFSLVLFCLQCYIVVLRPRLGCFLLGKSWSFQGIDRGCLSPFVSLGFGITLSPTMLVMVVRSVPSFFDE
jgi:hypothetical protein